MLRNGTNVLLRKVGIVCALCSGLLATSLGGNGVGLNVCRNQLKIKQVKNSSKSIEYALYTRNNKIRGENLPLYDIAALNCSNFDPKRGTVIVVHGYGDKKEFSHWKLRLKNALLKNHDLNVILVYWRGLQTRMFSDPIEQCRIVGIEVAKMISFIRKSSGSPLESFHLIGHSLGTHMAGHAGSQLKSQSSSLGRITGLDPAGAVFNKVSAADRLDPTDAMFVDVIHTDAGPHWTLSAYGFIYIGSKVQNGHLDFWPNGGNFQPGCVAEKLASISKGLSEMARRLMSCSQMRAYDYFIESLENRRCSFTAVKCSSYKEFANGQCGPCDKNNCARLGFYAAEVKEKFKGNSSSNFYLTTMGSAEFCAFQYVIRIRTSSVQVVARGSRIVVFIQGSKGSRTVDFNANLAANVEIKKLVSYSRNLGQVERVAILWSPNVLNWFWTEKAKTMSIDHLQVERLDARRMTPQTLSSHQGKSVQVKPNCLETVHFLHNVRTIETVH